VVGILGVKNALGGVGKKLFLNLI